MKQDERVIKLIKWTGQLYDKGIDCLAPKQACCNDKACSESCPRYKCLGCKVKERNEFCKCMTQLLLEDL